ncbi:MAG TPA: MBL fold metallo-hydrolase [Syntrophomonas sp.]|nr:MBL fold metallo-hydrolase [Syntrophomonas sp.]
MARFKILGTSAGPGVPAFYCDCLGCLEARQNPHLARTRTSVFIDSSINKILIDAGPDIRNQMIKESITEIDTIFLTHWHADHYSGLGEFEFYVRLHTREPITLYMPGSAVEEFERTYPDLKDIFGIIPWEYRQKYTFADISLTPLPAIHGVETAGFLVESSHNRIAYFPDTAGLSEASILAIENVDYLFCDATLHGENWYPNSHMTVEQAVALSHAVKAGQTFLTHLAMHYSIPVTTAQLIEELKGEPGVDIAYDGLTIELR